MTRGYKGGGTGDDKGLQGVTRGYKGLHGVREDNNGLQGVTRAYKGLQAVKRG